MGTYEELVPGQLLGVVWGSSMNGKRLRLNEKRWQKNNPVAQLMGCFKTDIKNQNEETHNV